MHSIYLLISEYRSITSMCSKLSRLLAESAVFGSFRGSFLSSFHSSFFDSFLGSFDYKASSNLVY